MMKLIDLSCNIKSTSRRINSKVLKLPDITYTNKYSEEVQEINKLCRDGYITSIGMCIYILSVGASCWVNIRTDEGLGVLCTLLGLNAPVNYHTAAMRYLVTIETLVMTSKVPPKTICVSSKRLLPRIDKDATRFFVVEGVLARQGKPGTSWLSPSNGASGRSLRPIMMRSLPCEISTSQEVLVDKFLRGTFSEEQLGVLKWLVGKGLEDPPSGSVCLYLYGKNGGEGKSRAINLLSCVLRGTISPLSKDYMSEGRLQDLDMDAVLSNRFVTMGESSVSRTGRINAPFLKGLFGDDPTLTRRGLCMPDVVMLTASNTIWFPHTDQLYPWRVRRMITLKLNKAYSGPSEVPPELLDADRHIFVTSCIREYNSRSIPGITIEDFLTNMFGTCTGSVTRGLVIDESSTDHQCYSATLSMSILCCIPIDSLRNCIRSSFYTGFRDTPYGIVISGLRIL